MIYSFIITYSRVFKKSAHGIHLGSHCRLRLWQFDVTGSARRALVRRVRDNIYKDQEILNNDVDLLTAGFLDELISAAGK